MATEGATSQSVTTGSTISSADADDRFNDALDALAAKAREYGQGDNIPTGIVAVEVDLVKALRDTRAQAMQEGRNKGYTYRGSSTLISMDRVLLGVIGNYIDQIEAEWA